MEEAQDLSSCKCRFESVIGYAPMMELVYILALEARFSGFKSPWVYCIPVW